MLRYKLSLLDEWVGRIIKNFYVEFALFLTVLFAFLFRGFVAGSDGASSWFSPFYNLKENFFVWNTYTVPGTFAANSFTSFFLTLFYSFVNLFTGSPALVQKYSWIIFFLTIGFFIFNFLNKKFDFKKTESYFLTVFVFFNPITQFFLWEKQHWAYYLAPIYFICFLLYKDYFKDLNYKNLYKISVIWFLAGFVFNQPAYFAAWLGFIIITFLLNIAFHEEKKRILIDHIKFLIFFLLINAVYFLPLVIGGSSQIQSFQDRYAAADPIPILRDLSTVNFFYSLIDITKGYNKFFSLNSVVIFIWSLFFIGIVYLTFLKKNKFAKKEYLYILSASIFLIFLIFFNKGISVPLPKISEYIFKLKIMYIFRDFKDKLALGYSLVISVFAIYFIKSHDRVLRIFFVFITVLSYLSFIGNAWLPSDFSFSNDLTYLKEVHIDNDQSSRILNLPLVDYSFFYTKEPSYSGDNPMKNIFKKEVLYTDGQTNQDTILLKQMFTLGKVDPVFFEGYLKRYNIKYILSNKNSYVAEDKSPSNYDINLLNKFDFIKSIQDSQRFQLFEYSHFLPKIYGKNVTFKRISPVEYRLNLKNIKEEEVLSYLDSLNPNWNLYIIKPTNNFSCTSFKKYLDVGTTECVNDSIFLRSLIPSTGLMNSIYNNYIINKSSNMNDNVWRNEWNLSSNLIKSNFNPNFYSQNIDGSLDVDLVLYFRPQIYFLLGLLITSGFILTMFLYSNTKRYFFNVS